MASTKNDVEMKDTTEKEVVEEDPEVKKRRVAKEAFALLVSGTHLLQKFPSCESNKNC